MHAFPRRRQDPPDFRHVYEGVAEQRTLALTREYLLDSMLHGLGALQISGVRPSPFDVGAEFGFGIIIDAKYPDEPGNQWIRNGARADAPKTFSATWTQDGGTGVKVTMLGEQGTTVYSGDGPYYVSPLGITDRVADGKYWAVPLIAVHRQGTRATFVALHEPFDRSSRRGLALRRLPDQNGAGVFEITGRGFIDCFVYVGARSGDDRFVRRKTAR